MNKLKATLVLSLMALALVAFLPMSMTAGNIDIPPGDTTEPDSCEGCHFYPGSVVMPEVVGQWHGSDHAMSYAPSLANTYCAKCHSPKQWDPAATHADNDPVPYEEWEAVTCGACHPPHDLRVEWGTPLGIYDPTTEDGWVPVLEEDVAELCEHCHSGERHGKEYQGYGNIMHKKDVTCTDCHMPEVPADGNPEIEVHSHTFSATEHPVESCGLERDECHPNHKEDWAVKQIEKGVHDKGSYGQEKDKGE